MVMTVPTQQHEPRPRGQRLENALTPAFVRNVAKAGRYGDGRAADHVQLLQNTWLVDKQPRSLPSLYPSI